MTISNAITLKHKRAIILSLVVMALLGTGFTWIQLGNKKISGIVRHGLSDEPMALAVINIGKSQTVSDMQGRFHIKVPEREQAKLTVSAPGYIPFSIQFDLPWYVAASTVEVSLVPEGLPVLVIDSLTGTPLPDLTVQVGNTSYITNMAGQTFVDSTLLTPLQLISIDQPGYKPRQIKLTRLPDNSAELPLVIKLEPHVLHGIVLSSHTQKPLANVALTVGQDIVYTNTDGEFSLYRLRTGDQIMASLEADEALKAEFTFERQSNMTIYMPPRHVTVNVIDDLSGLPVSNARVDIYGQSTLTDAQGRATLPYVEDAGILQVSQASYLTRTVSYKSQTINNIRLKPNTIQGIIYDADSGEPLTTTTFIRNGKVIPVDDVGHYQLADLAVGASDQPLQLKLKQAGYKPAQFTVAIDNGFNFESQNLDIRTCQMSPDAGTQTPCFDIALQPFKAKAIYIPFTFLADSSAVNRLFDLVERTELNAVILDVKSDTGHLAWDSQVLQADLLGNDGDRAGWMTLEAFLAEAQARDIYTIARMVIFKDPQLAYGVPPLAITYANGIIWEDGEGAAWASPYREEVWAYNTALAEEIAAMGFDEINLDYIRFPSDGNIGAIGFAREHTRETRTTAIRNFAYSMHNAIQPYGTFLSADVFGATVWVPPEEGMNIGQRVIDIAPYVDYIAPMIYPSTFSSGSLGYVDPSARPYDVIFRSQLAAMERMPPGTKVRPWLQGYWYNPYEMLLQKQAANDANSAGWFWWNAAGSYEESIFEKK